MKQLESNFIGKGEVKGFEFTMVKKSDYAYLYMVENKSFDSDNKDTYYEVFERKESKGGTSVLGGVEVYFEPREMYPCSNSFGLWAWSYNDLKSAVSKMNEIDRYVQERLKQ